MTVGRLISDIRAAASSAAAARDSE